MNKFYINCDDYWNYISAVSRGYAHSELKNIPMLAMPQQYITLYMFSSIS